MDKLKIIAHIYNGYTEKFGIPRQSGINDSVLSTIVFEKDYLNDDALRGIEEYSHLWLLWLFSKNNDEKWRPTVRPPRLGGNKRVGVFATRSPYRPNAIGLSSVKLIKKEKTENGTVLTVSGADILSGTPIIDIKPYITYTDSHPNAVCGFADEVKDYHLNVVFKEELLNKLPPEIQPAVIAMLENDPRPSYQSDEARIYGMCYSGYEIKFTVDGDILTVYDVEFLNK
jgi:tRNA-Thr(GGU) m(6)t(6)A37 methyltransferase TsaA